MATKATTAAPPILTNITSNQLECTLHCPEYHCLLRLQSSSSKTSHNYNSKPDISSIGVIPIIDDYNNNGAEESIIIHLLPTLLCNGDGDTATASDNKECEAAPSSGNDEANNYRNENVAVDGVFHNQHHHPCHHLIRISRTMQVQLQGRLQDASDGAVSSDVNSSNNNNETMEKFLLRSEAVFDELLSAVQQQLRREETTSRYLTPNADGATWKRTRISTTTTTTTHAPSSLTTKPPPPPLEYYHALLHQLHVLQNIPNVTDISLHKENSSSNSDLCRISVTCQDNKQRSHTWHAELYPTIVLTVDLPTEFGLDDITLLSPLQQGVTNKNNYKLFDSQKWWVNDNVDENNDEESLTSSLQQQHQQLLLPRIQHQFVLTLNHYQSLFDELDDLDTNLWILEPTLPARRSCVERRIALWEGGASVVIVLDHEKPRGVPIMVRFLGVTKATIKAVGSNSNSSSGDGGTKNGSIADWRASFANFVAEEEEGEMAVGEMQQKRAKDDVSTTKTSREKKRWSEERSIRENLELWLGSPLPSPLSTEKSDYLVECGICYAHRLPIINHEGGDDYVTNEYEEEDGPLPEEKCNNPNCNRYYHQSCLFEWLHSLPTARVSFDRIFGNCPYCCEGVSVKVLNRAQQH